ncbi:FHA domain-containing protein [Microcella sp.]|uniref:FHA domain-containing protein FhaB/FipA n=1 Tax=Microcella sp. TaxID=1913979 RepID=UPI00299F75E0|nr:FHA domain-containing protein [Microcella sp.]MDX2026297.1 FHA domain-containing protein [Microcella sp.]
MSELTLLLLRIGFLILMWSFIFAIVYTLRSDLFGTKVRRLPAAASAAAPVAVAAAMTPATAAGSGPARRLVITSGAKEGLELPLEGDQLTIGRSADSGLVIRDDYTSTHHARLMLWDGTWMVQDLDSTNGTILNGKKVGAPTAVPLNSPISIGTTTFELRR